MKIAVVGAGMAGLACAEALHAAGRQVVAFDKGRGPGGRMSTRRVDSDLGVLSFDHGAQYFTLRDPAFIARAQTWLAQGQAAPWPAAGADAYVGAPGMNAPIRQMASALDVRWGVRIDALARDGTGWRLIGEGAPDLCFDQVVCALPSEQAQTLLASVQTDWAERARAAVSDPCWTLMLAFAAPVEAPFDAQKGDGAIGWMARNSAKPGRSGPEAWVVQGSPDWSRAHLEQSADWVVAELSRLFAEALGRTPPPAAFAAAHRWRYAKSGRIAAADAAAFAWDAALGLGVCGDSWVGPRVEGAWISGDALGRAMTAT